MPTDLPGFLSRVSRPRLESRVRELEGVRHGWGNPEAVENRAQWITRAFEAAGLEVESGPVPWRDRTYRNLVAKVPGSDPKRPGILLGAHYDGPSGSPGADDNASGVAVLLEVAEILARTSPLRTIQFVAFTLEEPQDVFGPFLVGSEHIEVEITTVNSRIQVRGKKGLSGPEGMGHRLSFSPGVFLFIPRRSVPEKGGSDPPPPILRQVNLPPAATAR